jgi:hypothetical protein
MGGSPVRARPRVNAWNRLLLYGTPAAMMSERSCRGWGGFPALVVPSPS